MCNDTEHQLYQAVLEAHKAAQAGSGVAVKGKGKGKGLES